MNDEYLWDPTLSPDEAIASLEDLLCVHRYEHRPLPASEAARAVVTPTRRLPWVEIAVMVAAAALVLGLFAVLRAGPPEPPPADAPAVAPSEPVPESEPPKTETRIQVPEPSKDEAPESETDGSNPKTPVLEDPFAGAREDSGRASESKKKKSGISSPDLKNPFRNSTGGSKTQNKKQKGKPKPKLLDPFAGDGGSAESGGESPDLADPFRK
jgi:outer membrane biosynthesis protein TonB